MICNNLEILLRKTNRMREAENYYKEALTIYKKYPHLASQAETVRNILSQYFID